MLILVSPPFGRWLRIKGMVPVKGSYTVKPRKGLIQQIIKTLRPVRQGWVNQIGLRNRGIYSIEHFRPDVIYSIVGFHDTDWQAFYEYIPAHAQIELNISCPNCDEYKLPAALAKAFIEKYRFVSIKLPPTEYTKTLIELYAPLKPSALHLCNTYPSPKGGISGYPLKPHSVALIKWAKTHYPEIPIIGGGGIYTPQDIKEYLAAGADGLSLSTVFFNPIKAFLLFQFFNSKGNDKKSF